MPYFVGINLSPPPPAPLRQVLDAMQKQNEIHARGTAEIQHQIQILTK